MSSSVRNVEIVDIYADDNELGLEEFDEEYYDDNYDNEENDFAQADDLEDEITNAPVENAVVVAAAAAERQQSVTRRVMVRKSPTLSCFYRHHPVLVCLDCGAESNLISLTCARKLHLVVLKCTQGALQADSKTPLTVVGEVKEIELIRGAQTLIFEGLVVKEEIGEIVGGEPFLEINDIAIRSSKKEIRIKDSEVISYACHQ